MNFRHPIPRSGKPIKKRNPKRRKSEFARCYGSKARVEWIKSLDCLCNTWRCDGRPENAHIKTGGMGYKTDYTKIIPLCPHHHRKLHSMGVREFERFYLVNLENWAAKIQERWLEDTETT